MTKSKSRAALDAWTEEADRLLAEQRDALLSPSQILGLWDVHRSAITTTVSELGSSLDSFLRR
jgi:hypothetical protein